MDSSVPSIRTELLVSLGFGIMFSTLVTLLVVPCFYLLIEDIRRGLRWLWYGKGTPTRH